MKLIPVILMNTGCIDVDCIADITTCNDVKWVTRSLLATVNTLSESHSINY